MKATEIIAHLRSLRPSDARAALDDALFLAWNVFARSKELTLPREHKQLLRANRRLRMAGRGERCWILGNGPSLREHDLLALRDEHVFVVNRFIHHEQAHLIRPRYYVIVDPKFGAGTWGHDFVEEIERRLPDVSMFTGYDGWHYLRERGLLEQHRRYVVYPNQFFHFGYPWEIDLTRGIPGADNVTKTAISIATWMGFSEINLLGIDGNGLLLSDNSHFYGHVPGPTDQQALEKAMLSSSTSMRSWRSLPGYLARRGVRLVSRNPRSVLNALPLEPWPEDLPRSSSAAVPSAAGDDASGDGP